MHIISLCMFNKVLILILMFQLNCIMSTIICNTAVSVCGKRARRGGPGISGCGGPGFSLSGPVLMASLFSNRHIWTYGNSK